MAVLGRRSALAVATVTLVASTSCASLGALLGIRPPRFEEAGRPAEVRLLGPSLSRPFGGAAVQLWARVENPNPFSLTLSTLSGRLLFEDVEAADVDLPLGLPLVSGEAQTGSTLISAGRVFGLAAVIGAINSLLFAVAVTVGAFVYNVSADLVGGIEVTLSERD